MSRHLMAKMRRHSSTPVEDLINRVRSATGINLKMEDSGGGPGGGSNVLSGRLEDGSWVVASDSDGPISDPDLSDRTQLERTHGPQGWHVGIYPNESWEHNGQTYHSWDSGAGPLHVHVDKDALTHDLPRVIQHALSTVPDEAKTDARAKDSGVDYDAYFKKDAPSDDDGFDIFGDRP